MLLKSINNFQNKYNLFENKKIDGITSQRFWKNIKCEVLEK